MKYKHIIHDKSIFLLILSIAMTLALATHVSTIAKMTDRIINIEDGKLASAHLEN